MRLLAAISTIEYANGAWDDKGMAAPTVGKGGEEEKGNAGKVRQMPVSRKGQGECFWLSHRLTVHLSCISWTTATVSFVNISMAAKKCSASFNTDKVQGTSTLSQRGITPVVRLACKQSNYAAAGSKP